MTIAKRLMKRVLIVVYGFFVSSPAISQTQTGLKAGFGINTMTQATGSEKPFIGIQTAIFGKIPISNFFLLQPSLGYYAKGYKRLDLTLFDDMGNVSGAADANFRIDYAELAIPLQFALHNGNVQWVAGLGPFVAYALGGRIVYKNVSGLAEPKNEKIRFGKNGESRGDAGVTFLFSTIYRTKWVASLNYDQGLAHGLKTVSIGLSIGYFFK